MFFIALLILTTLSIAGSAAFFSIYGLAQIFTGAFWPVVIMATSLEAGKLVGASFLYRYWKKLSFLMKTYLITAIFILMVITSAGIFGFLSSAYQEDVLPLDDMKAQITILEERKAEIQGLKLELQAERADMDAQIQAIPGTHSTNRRRMRESQAEDRERIRTELARLSNAFQTATAEQADLRRTVITQEVHTGPIIFIAEAFNREVDDATKWMILLIIFAFDPLAVVLTIGANIAVLDRRKILKPVEDPDPEPEEGEPEPTVTEVEQIQEPVTITRLLDGSATVPEKGATLELGDVQGNDGTLVVETGSNPEFTPPPVEEAAPDVPDEWKDWDEARIRGALEKLKGMKSLTPAETSQKLILEEMLRSKTKGQMTPTARMARLANPS